MDSADVVVCGGGGAGCVIAARLAEARPDLEIVLLERGPDNRDVKRLTNPLDSIIWFFGQNPHLKWFECEAQTELNGRRPRIPAANLLGGGTSVNTLLYNTAAPSDFDDWDQPGWEFADLEPLINRGVKYTVPNPTAPHGPNGKLEVSLGGHVTGWGEEVISAVQAAVPGTERREYVTSYHPGCSHSVGRQPKLISERGLRSDTASSYIHSCKATNLTVITGCQVSRVLFDKDEATGVEYVVNDVTRTIKARKQVVLSCGTLGSPSVLERSGIGNPDVLSAAGVPVLVDLPGVGEELNDHQLTWGGFHSSREDVFEDYARGVEPIKSKVDKEWETTGKGIAASNGWDWGYKLRPTPEEIQSMGPDFEKYWKEIGSDKPDKPLWSDVAIPFFYSHLPRPPTGHFLCFAGFHNYPGSRGSIHITSADPLATATVHAGLLNHPADLPVHVWHYKVQREIARRMPWYLGEIVETHPKFSPESVARLVRLTSPYREIPTDRIRYSAEDDKVIENWVRDTIATAYHVISTCSMKAREAGGVVDHKLDVYGVKRLKVADLSICPKNVSCNTTSVVLLVAERAVDIILEDLAVG